MAQRRTPDRWDSLEEPRSEVQVTVVQVTVVPDPRGRALRERIADIRVVVSARVVVGLAVAVAGIGAIVVGVPQRDRTRAPRSARVAQSRGGSPSTSTLPASSNGPTTCTVYESGYATQVVFQSKGFEVRAECRAWTRNNGDEGYLWGYEPLSASAETAESTQVCYLTDPQCNVTASVILDTGFVAVSAVERANGASACERLLAIGWTAQVARRRHPRRQTSTTGPEPHRRRRAP